MNNTRRTFIKQIGMATAGTLVATQAVQAFQRKGSAPAQGSFPFGIQLWTVKEDMYKDAQATLRQLASFGYKQIESFEGDNGIYWGMRNKDFAAFLKGVGMSLVSAHCDINTNFERKANEAAAIGLKYLICPAIGPQKTLEEYRKYAVKFNGLGEVCRKAGIRFAYHNHDYSFKPLEGNLGQNILMEYTDPALVDFELDMYWASYASIDPVKFLEQYPGRVKLCHVKDLSKGKMSNGNYESVELGKGSINYPAVLKDAKNAGMQYFIVEQEYFEGTTPLGSSKANAAYLKKLKLT
jgi:sugar phosphate isomerase/epimerase